MLEKKTHGNKVIKAKFLFIIIAYLLRPRETVCLLYTVVYKQTEQYPARND